MLLAIGIICLAVGAACLVYAGFAFRRRGPLLMNDYLLGRPSQREKLKTPENYRFVGIIFSGVGGMFLLTGLMVLLQAYWLSAVVIVLAVALAVFALVPLFRQESKKH